MNKVKFASKFILKDLLIFIISLSILIYIHNINILDNYIVIENLLKILIYYYFIAVISIIITERYEISFISLMLGILLVDNIYSINIYFLIPSLILLILRIYYILLKLEDKK